MSVCVSVIFVSTGRTLAKIQQNTFKHLRSNGVNPIFSSVSLNYIFDLKCLKYMTFVSFRMLSEAKIMKKNSAIHIETFAVKRCKSRFSPL